MRIAGLLPLLLLLASCRSGKTEIEAGAILLEIKSAQADQIPDELRVWVYDDTGRLWDGERVPAEGTLAPKGPQDLGSILIQPGPLTGNLRVHVQGLALGLRILDGTLIAAPVPGNQAFDLVLDSAILPDEDGDGVPDVIDDCARAANPMQGGCPPASDAAVIESPDVAFDVPVGLDGQPDAVLGRDARDGGNAPPLFDAVSPDTTIVLGDAARDALSIDSRVRSDVQWQHDTSDALRDGAVDSADARAVYDARLADTRRDLLVDSPPGGPDADEGCGDLGPCNLSQGALCAEDIECASGVCADGVCCNNACLGPCRSCSQPDFMGLCQAYAVGSDPEAECSSGNTCNGAGACGAPPSPNLANGQLCGAGAQCASGFCVDGVCCNSKCDEPCFACGTGNCLTVRRTEDAPQCSDGRSCDRKGICVEIADHAPEFADRLLL